jgi:hypothetical protein
MRVNRSALGWGLFFIVVGLVPLAVRAGYVEADTVRRAWELWPLILIGIGLGLVLQRTKAAFVGGLVVAVTFGLMAGSVLAVGVGSMTGITGCGFGAGNQQPFAAQSGSLGDTARVDVSMRCGELTASAGSGSDWRLSGTSTDGAVPNIAAASDRLRIEAPDMRGFSFPGGASWQLTLPRDPELTLNVSADAGSARLDLDEMRVSELDLSVNAGDAHVNLSTTPGIARIEVSANAGSVTVALPAPSGRLTGNISANAGSVTLCVPDGVALRIQASDNPLSGNNFDTRGLSRSGNVWTSQGYTADGPGIDLTTSANLGAVTLNPESGCE